MTKEWWIVVDCDGGSRAVLDRLVYDDEREAVEAASAADGMWGGADPHRAVRVVPAEDVEARIAAAVASERERCAILCDGFEDATTSAREAEIARNLASKIRGLKP